MPIPPSPLPVYIVDPAPPAWSAEWWIDAGIPLLGVLGSIAVTALVVYVTIRLAKLERQDREREVERQKAEREREEAQRDRERRGEFLEVASSLLQRWESEQPSDRSAIQLQWLRDSALLRAAAVRATTDAPDVARWLLQEADVAAEIIETGIPGLPPELDHARVGWKIFGLLAGHRLQDWALTGKLDTLSVREDMSILSTQEDSGSSASKPDSA